MPSLAESTSDSVTAGMFAAATIALTAIATQAANTFIANATAGIYAGSIIPESQLLVTGQITGKDFVTRVQEFYEQELAG